MAGGPLKERVTWDGGGPGTPATDPFLSLVTTTRAADEDRRTAVDKAVMLLKSIAEYDTEIGVSELARRTRLTKSTTFRLLGILERNGLVDRVGGGYRLSARLFDIGTRVYGPGPGLLRERLLPYLVDLHGMTHETVHLAVLHRTEIVYVYKLHGHRSARVPSEIGCRRPAHSTGVGKALLAFDHDAAELVLNGPLPAHTPYTIRDPEALRRELRRVREDGIAVDRQETVTGLCCVATPVMGAGRRPVAALSVVVADHRFDPARLAPALRRVAHQASRALSTGAPRRP
ncbi:IclR family transcriptional regulator [Actinomadura pelletieri DSM 43383]|uniref:IclR family transcriptional regulator n=1 Tax=Actinomadura pelletieri DSM 43383 TaxID=1120940 RepID=A0A495QT28_9ACTN|nr:IclR family transcriptional regulator [Actinomadura pelletieri]RKS76674.1 IclR family transcriptional regulator [Actinomadura pelletieri DSM 43383]